ncbi:hypothetical protein C8J56DRAFT_91810 [Mycena floridula]|nr:hypothetical protein C8J56DRAFT_91810 [Mycena floridula]
MRFAILLSLAVAALAVPTKRDVSILEADLATTLTKVTALNTVATGLNPGNLVIANKFITSTLALTNSLAQATKDAVAIATLSPSDDATILQSLKDIATGVSNVVDVAIAKKDALNPVAALAVQNWTGLNAALKSFVETVVAKSAGKLAADAPTIQAGVSAKITVGIAASS